MYRIKSFDYISMILDRPLEIVIQKAKEIAAITGKISYAENVSNKELKKKAVKENQKKADQKNKYAMSSTKNNLLKRDSRIESRVIDYTKLVLVKIDQKTSIYINLGMDPEKAKNDFIKKYRQFDTVENPWKKIK